MCFSSPKQPTPTPPPSPAPIPTASEASPTANNEAQQKQLQMMRYGIASTIKTSPTGVDMNPMYNSGQKKKLGQ